ncbi:MAG: NADPH:quinone oxidoreductase family protein [Bacteroidetes bacterium]|nr:MAG: NADPH:quinone oxidoreductase family protein [Bacteroidota bacterium]
MKAILCKRYGPPSSLVLEEVPSPEPGPKEVRVKIHACSVNFPDTLMIQGLYQFKPPMPFSPGSDIAGVVSAVGEGVKHLKVGDKVFGLIPHGGFAEEAVAPARLVFPKPPMMPDEVAAAFMMTYATSYHALKDRAHLKAGESLLVLGAAGGVGLAAVELGKLMGARVIAAASTDEKLALCKDYGADALINYHTQDLKEQTKALTQGRGADVVYDPVGGDYSEAALRATAWGGRFLVVGFPAGIPKIPLNLPLLKGCSIVGVFWGRFTSENPQLNLQNTQELINMYAQGKLKPHIHRFYALEEAPQALQDMMDRKVKGKVIIKMK